jgi:hypothetical protein
MTDVNMRTLYPGVREPILRKKRPLLTHEQNLETDEDFSIKKFAIKHLYEKYLLLQVVCS